MTRNQFRLLTILCFASLFAGALWDLWVPMPAPLEAYQESERNPLEDALIYVALFTRGALLISLVTLLTFHRLAPAFFVCLNVAAFAISPMLGYAIYSPIAELLSALSTFCAGAMVVMMYMTDVRTYFVRNSARI